MPAESQSDFKLFAYRAILSPTTVPSPTPSQEPELRSYVRLGYDVVERNPAIGILGFGCSPLSCNGMAENIPVNEFCLLDDLGSAFAVAQRFEIEKPEPGPYVVIEVLAAP